MKLFNRISAEKTEDIIYLFLLFLYSYTAILDDSLLRLTPVINLLKWGISIAGLILFLYRNKGIPPVKKLVFASIVLAAFYIAAKATGRTYLIIYAVFIIIAEGCEPDKTVKTWLLSTVFALLTILFLCAIGVLTDHIYLYDSGRACHCLGFGYYSTFPFLVLYSSIAYIYLKKDTVKIYHYALVVLVNLIMYRLTTLNLTFYLTFLFIALDYSLVKIKKVKLNQGPVMAVSSLLYPLGVLATSFMMAKYNPEAAGWTKLNTAMHGRPDLSHQAYLRYPLSLFGNRISMTGNSALRTTAPGAYFYIDSGFAYSLLGYGLIFTLVVVALYSVLYLYSCRTNNKHLYAWLTCVLIFTMMNNVWVDVYYNPALLISFAAYTELSKWEGRWRPILVTVESAGLAAVAAWLTPWFKALGDTAAGGNSRMALLAAALLLMLLLGLAFSLGSLLLKLLQHQRPLRRQVAWTGALLVCCGCGILALNWQVNRLTARNAEKLKSERAAVETVQQAVDCRLLVDSSSEEIYRRAFEGVGRSLYHGNNLAALRNVACITGVEKNLQGLIGKGYLYTEISDEHALYTNSPDAAAALQAAGYHLTGYYSHDCAVNTDGTEALRLPSSAYLATYDLYYAQNDGQPAPAPDEVVATLTVMAQPGETTLATRDVLFSEFGEDGTCSIILNFSIGTTGNVEFLAEVRSDSGDVLVKSIHYCQYPSYDIHFTCDIAGRRISELCFDLSGNPGTLPDGSHSREYGYDNAGNTTFIRYYDLDGNPLTLAAGYAEVHRRFNGKNQLIDESFFDAEGQPCLLWAGYASLARTYDKEGRLTEEKFLGTAGEPVDCVNGYSMEQRDYDGSGNLVACKFLDTEARPVNAYPGYAEVRRTYDADNRLVREEYFSADGTPALRAADYSAWEQEYDGEGRLTIRRYLSTDGQPVLRTDGFSEARWVKAADSSVRNLELFDLTGNMVPLDGINLAQDLEGDGWSAWLSPVNNAQNSCFNIGSMNLGEKAEGDVYTCQLEIEFSGVTASEGRQFAFWAQGAQDGAWVTGNVWNSGVVKLTEAPEDGVYRFAVTNTVSKGMTEISTFDIGFRCDYWASGAFRIRNVKIEKGAEASEWSPGL